MGFKRPPVILLVAGPKGRSIVLRLLQTHERIAVLPDSAWISDLAPQRRTFEAPGGVKLFVEAFLEHRSAPGWSFGRDELLAACEGIESYPRMVRAVLNAYEARLPGKGSVLVDASPHLAANLHLVTLLMQRARVFVVREPELTAEAPIRTGHEVWFDGALPITDAVATLERERFVQIRLDDLLKDPVGNIRTLIAYLQVGVNLDGFTRVEGLPSATKPARVARFGPQKPGDKEPAPVRWARQFFERYPKLGRKARAWANANRPLVNRTLKKLRKVSR